MSVAVVVPFRGGCPYRERAWEWVREQYAKHHPSWEIIEAAAPEGQWSKGAALAPTIEETMAEIVVQADADVWCEGLEATVVAVAEGLPWAIPHDRVHRLDKRGSTAVINGAPWQDQALDRPSYSGLPGGGIVVAARDTLVSIPMDERFKGWGQEDEAFAIALNCLLGPPWRGSADLLHLWHPPQERMTRRRGSPESWSLRCRYFAARNDPDAMRALLEESRVADRTPEPALHDHP